jgi:Ca2+:H+ antiporter
MGAALKRIKAFSATSNSSGCVAQPDALLIVPILVLMSHVYGKPVNLEFTIAEVVALGAGAVLTTQIGQDGVSNRLNGLQMLVAYAMIAVLFFFLPV